MTIPSTERKAGPYLGDDFVTVFAFNFRVFAEEDIRVVFTDALGVETDLVLTSQYTVALNPDQNTSPGGFVTSLVGALEIGATITILGDLAYDQPYDVPDGGAFRPESLENQLDRTIMQVQQIVERLNRTLRLPVGTSLTDLAFPEPDQGTLLGWDEDTDTLKNYLPQDILQIAGGFGFRYDVFAGTGAQTAFNLTINPGSIANLFVYVNGVRLTPVAQYSFSGTVLTFTAAPANLAVILVVTGETLGVAVPAFGSVTSDKLNPLGVAVPIGSTLPANIVGRPQLADAAVGTNEIEDAAVNASKLGNLAVLTANIGNAEVTYPKIQNVGIQSILGNPGTVAQTVREIGIATGFSYRNRVINGGATVAQRVAVSYTVGVNGYSGPDRFTAGNIGAGGAFTQSQGTLTVESVAENTVRQAVTSVATNLSGGNYWSGISQLLEGFNCYDLVNKPVALSFVFNANVSGTYSVTVRDGASSLSFVTTFVASAGVPVRVVIPVPAVPAGATVPRSSALGLQVNIGGQNIGANAVAPNPNAWQGGNFFAASGATNWSTTLGATIEVTQLQLECGSINTPFERLPQNAVRAQCQRYYEIGTLQQPIVGLNYMAATVTYNTYKRVAGTVAFIDLAGNLNRFSSGGGNNLAVGGGGLSANQGGFFVDILPAFALVAENNWWRFLYAASAEL